MTTEYQARVLKTQIDALKQNGDLALQLIESAIADPQVGRHLDVRV